MNIKKHITNVKALQAFQVIRFGVLLLISIIFTKTNLKVGEIGVYETFLLIAGGISFFWTGGMLQSLLGISNNSKTFGKSEKNSIFFNVFIVFLLLSIFSAILIFFSQSVIAKLFSIGGNKIPYMKILFMYIIVSGPVNLIEYFYLLKNKAIHIIIYGLLSFALQLVCVTLPVLLGYDLGYGLYGLVFVNILRFGVLLIQVYKYSELRFSKEFLKEFFQLSYPLVLGILLSGSAQYIDAFLVSFKFDEASLAIFRYGARELPFFVLLIYAFSNAMTPKFSDPNNIDAAISELKKGTKSLMSWIFPSSVLLILTSKYLYPLVFNPNFLQSADVFNIYLMLIVIRFIFSRTILIGFKDTKPIFWSSLIEVIINVSLSLIFINIWGIIGVAIGTLISYLFESLYLLIYLKKKHNISPNSYLPVKPYVLWTTLLIIAFAFSFYI
ncbi:MAG: oligosaccharide flippase family protein [Bacteroidales bacterium]|nr:polysaccharide biosynthesis C-terminal domain-containing protein [Bacteroidales bacterium]MCK9498988.1 polysaccharide biosynthesis C-terminal domain-containing protein [Bacteroidales bacterium]MDY0314615.1 lipid II flippase MurJ [Bacteroidales bacterium]NLB86931.1 oligosaccharide flippase family protein [Bacteroidales bacterium]NLB87056.1 oligosaccharide flippase family protein [Bacteroidales bacterium]